MATHSSIFAWRIPWTEEPGFRSLIFHLLRQIPAILMDMIIRTHRGKGKHERGKGLHQEVNLNSFLLWYKVIDYAESDDFSMTLDHLFISRYKYFI